MTTLPDEIAAALLCALDLPHEAPCMVNRDDACARVLALIERREADWRKLRWIEDGRMMSGHSEEYAALRARLGLEVKP